MKPVDASPNQRPTGRQAASVGGSHSHVHRFPPAITAGWLCLAALLAGSCGCDSAYDESFGSVSGRLQYTSFNGLGLFRRMCVLRGHRCLNPTKLSPRLEKVSTIVLVGDTFRPPGSEARYWLEEWLASGSDRTVIYFGRDFNARQYYYDVAGGKVSPARQEDFRNLRSELASAELAERLRAVSEMTFCEWFHVQVDQPPQQILTLQSEWAEQLKDLPEAAWPVRTRLVPPSAQYRSALPKYLANPATTTQTNASPAVNDPTEEFFYYSRWTADEFETQEQWDEAFDQLLASEVLLSSQEGTPLVFRLTSEDRLGNGQILVVANGAPFLNGSLVLPFFGAIAENLLDQCLPEGGIALLAYSDNGILISLADDSDSRGAGLEMLLHWPLSAVTMPAALVGLLALVSLLPILGRPQRLPDRAVSDFGLHVEAVGDMLSRSGDQDFARSAIVDYFTQVREERPPAWLTDMAASEVPSTPAGSQSSSIQRALPPQVVAPPKADGSHASND